MNKNTIDKILHLVREKKEEYLIVFIANVSQMSSVSYDFEGTSVLGDYYSAKQFQEITEAISANGFELLCYYNENDFISDYLSGTIQKNREKEMLIISTAKTGISVGRKSLIPAFCELNGVKYLGCDPYIISFAKDKLHWHIVLDKYKIPVSQFWGFNKKYGWYQKNKPNCGETVIAKLNSESCSMGLSSQNISTYSSEFDDFLFKLSDKYKQNLIVEKFIPGFEVETPLIVSNRCTMCFEPIGIMMNKSFKIDNKILDYNTRLNDLYIFKEFSLYNDSICKEIQKCAMSAAEILGLSGICRIDFRINENMDYFITDIATTPFITKNSSIGVCFENYGYEYKDFFALIIWLILDKYSII